MRQNARHVNFEVRAYQKNCRPVVLTIAGMHFSMTVLEARAVADRLHDSADRVEVQP